MHVITHKCLRDSRPSFAHGGDPDFYCQRSLFISIYRKRKAGPTRYFACGNHMYLLLLTTNF